MCSVAVGYKVHFAIRVAIRFISIRSYMYKAFVSFDEGRSRVSRKCRMRRDVFF
jgi:hypothetical protein